MKFIKFNFLKILKIPVEIVCRLPHDYPKISQPEVLVCCSKENINKKFYEVLKKHIQEIHDSDCSVLSIIDWIKDNLFKYLATNKAANETKNTSVSFARAWVYFHHIYSTEKRQNLVKWAIEFDLSGFVMPGKPGIMCLEGDEMNIQEYMTRVKKLPWQKVQIKDITTIKSNNLNELRKFKSFEEMSFTNESSQSHDLGLLFNFLKEKELSNVFSLFFGVDGKASINNNNKSE